MSPKKNNQKVSQELWAGVLALVSLMVWRIRLSVGLATAGIIYVSDTELGWQPLVASWLAKRKPSEAALLQPSFDRYVERMLQFVRWAIRLSILLAHGRFIAVSPGHGVRSWITRFCSYNPRAHITSPSSLSCWAGRQYHAPANY